MDPLRGTHETPAALWFSQPDVGLLMLALGFWAGKPGVGMGCFAAQEKLHSPDIPLSS